MPRGVPPCVYFIWYLLCFLDFSEWLLSHVWEVFSYYLFKYFLWPFLSLLSSGTPIIPILVCLILSQSSLRLSLFLVNLFFFFCSASGISTSLSSTLLICSSASCVLLLVPSINFFFDFLGLHLWYIEVPRHNWSHSNARAEPLLQPTPELMATLDPLPTERGQGSNPKPHGS